MEKLITASIKKIASKTREFEEIINYDDIDCISFSSTKTKDKKIVLNNKTCVGELTETGFQIKEVKRAGEKDEEINIIDINLENNKIFLGKMEKDGNNMYSLDTIIPLLDFFLKNTIKGQKIRIVLAKKVGDILNPLNDGNYITAENQKKLILKAFKENFQLFSQRTDDLEITYIEDENKELFEVLENNGINGLESEKEINLKGKITSLNIAKYLYEKFQTSESFKREIIKLSPGNLKNTSGNHSYYGLIEIAIRITDFINRYNLQGGLERQEQYDDIISKILFNPNYHSGIFKNLGLFAGTMNKDGKTSNQEKTFDRIYINNEKIQNRIKKNRLITKVKKGVVGICMGLTLISGGYGTMKYGEKSKEKEFINTVFNGMTFVDFDGKEVYDIEEKIIIYNKFIKEVYKYFELIYQIKESDLIKVGNLKQNIIEYFLKENKNQFYPRHPQEFVEYYILKNKIIFESNNINIKPYKSFKEHEKGIFNLNQNEEYLSGENINDLSKNLSKEKIGYFYYKGTFGDGLEKDLFLYKIVSNGEERYVFVNDSGEIQYGYSTIIKDYLCQVDDDFLSLYRLIRVSDYLYNGKIIDFHEEQKQFVDYNIHINLIREYLNNKEEIKKIIKSKGYSGYFELFFRKFKKQIFTSDLLEQKNLLIENITLNTIDNNEQIVQFESEMKNSIIEKSGEFYYRSEELENVSKESYYTMQNGKLLYYGIKSIKGKKYLLGSNDGKNFSIGIGVEISKDYFEKKQKEQLKGARTLLKETKDEIRYVTKKEEEKNAWKELEDKNSNPDLFFNN